jgi:hypothetical protein
MTKQADTVRIIIAGSRSFTDYKKLMLECDQYIEGCILEIEIVSGTAAGADQLGERYASERGYEVKRFPPDWNKFGKRAGYLRNKDMADYSDVLIAFWDGESRGTKHMIDIAKADGLIVNIVGV